MAISAAIETKPLGDQARSHNYATVDDAAKQAGFTSREDARRARKVVESGVLELVEAGGGVDINNEICRCHHAARSGLENVA